MRRRGSEFSNLQAYDPDMYTLGLTMLWSRYSSRGRLGLGIIWRTDVSVQPATTYHELRH